MNDIDCINDTCGEAVGLLMTYRCNLKCKYCYIHTKRNQDMTLEKAQSIIEPFLCKKGGRLDIAFMGGETLMAIDVIKPLVEWIEQGSWNRPYRFFGSTNGTLLNADMKDWFKAHAHIIALGLSYDGLPASQNNNRGNNEIDIDFFINTWPKQPIQMTINTETVGQMAEGVIYLLEKGALVHPNVAYESKEWGKDKIYEYAKQLNELISYYDSHPEKPLISQFIHNLNEYARCIDKPVKQIEVCGAGNEFQVFDTDGLSYPCHILSPLVLEGEKLERIKAGLVDNTTDFSDNDCERCPYVSSCPTCIACNYLYRNNLTKRDNTHCEIMKLEVKAFIKKEILRLSKKDVLSSKDAKEIDSIKKLMELYKL